MLLFPIALALGIAVGYLLGGRLQGLAGLELRAPAVVVVALGAQVAVEAMPVGARLPVVAASYAVLGAWVAVNAWGRAWPLRLAFGVVAAGWLLNLVVIAANGGMPVAPASLAAAGIDGGQGPDAGALAKHVPADGGTRFAVLGDVIPLPALSSVVSAGDVALFAGLVALVGLGMATSGGRSRSASGRPPPAPDGHDGPAALEQAARVIERHGWCRGEFQDLEGRVCLEFALLLARVREGAEARLLVEEELAARGLPGCPLVDWNDLHATGELEVLDVLRAAAAHSARDGAAGVASPAG